MSSKHAQLFASTSSYLHQRHLLPKRLRDDREECPDLFQQDLGVTNFPRKHPVEVFGLVE